MRTLESAFHREPGFSWNASRTSLPETFLTVVAATVVAMVLFMLPETVDLLLRIPQKMF